MKSILVMAAFTMIVTATADARWVSKATGMTLPKKCYGAVKVRSRSCKINYRYSYGNCGCSQIPSGPAAPPAPSVEAPPAPSLNQTPRTLSPSRGPINRTPVTGPESRRPLNRTPRAIN